MKIVRIIARLNVGGPARHVVWLNEALQDDEFQSVLLTGRVPGGEEDMSYFAEQHKVKPIFIEQMSRELSPKDIVSLWKVYRHILREKPDIIHTHTAKAGTVGRTAGFFYRWLTPKTLIGKPRKVEIIHTFHGHIFHGYYSNLKTKIFIFIEKTLAKFTTDKIIVISNQQKREINTDFNVGKSEQFEVIPLGIDLEAFKDWREKRHILREEIGAKEDEILVGLVGRLTEVKNHEMFLRVIRLFNETKETDFPKVKFIIIGDGNLRENLENSAKEFGISDSIIFLGNRNDADIFYAGLDIIALTSVNEGTPLSLIEAMANEKPVISTLVGGVVDLLGEIKSEKEGYIICKRGIGISSNDSEGFCKGLRYLVKNEKLRFKLKEKGKNFVLERYDKRRLINDIKSLYENLLEN
ncbi:MAG: glycosyltransferase [Acidobacteriota bacterium]|jgi:glycosyltransferase involved in cell wall biosynthesis|nr:glycosyltransferase [Acidobacteriota bacterium]